MAELADAADLKSAGLKRPVGVRVPLSAPGSGDPSTSLRSAQDFGCGLPLGYASLTPAERLNLKSAGLTRPVGVRVPLSAPGSGCATMRACLRLCGFWPVRSRSFRFGVRAHSFISSFATAPATIMKRPCLFLIWIKSRRARDLKVSHFQNSGGIIEKHSWRPRNPRLRHILHPRSLL